MLERYCEEIDVDEDLAIEDVHGTKYFECVEDEKRIINPLLSIAQFSNDDVELVVIIIFLKCIIYIGKKWKIRKARPGRVFLFGFYMFC